MRRRLLAVRLVAALLAALLSLTGPGAALAHGVAHAREHRAADAHDADDHHAPHLLDRLAALVHGHAHHDEATDAPAAVSRDEHDVTPASGQSEHPAASGDASLAHDGSVARPSQHDGSHGHARLDAQAISRFATGMLLPALPVLVPSAPVIVATVPPPPAASPLRLADPPTGPPPPSRAPPIG